MTDILELELIAQDAEAVRVAAEIGAKRVELCQALALGGLTPSIGTIEQAVEVAGGRVEVHPLIRVRAGNFTYSDEEVAVMAADVRRAVAAGASGVVVGCLDERGAFSVAQMASLRDAAGDAAFSAHRAIDVTPDPLVALDQLIELGVGRVLTSGGAATAATGVAGLAGLVERAAGRIAIMAGSGVNAANVADVVASGVHAVHFSAKRTVSDTSGVSMGSASSEGVGSYDAVDRDQAHAIAIAARAAFAHLHGGVTE